MCQVAKYRDYFVYVPSQWEATLQCNIFPHWLSAYTKHPWEQRGRQLHPTGQCQFQAFGKHNITARYTLLSMQYTFTGILWQTLLDKEACIRDICYLTLWGQMTHICICKLTLIGSDSGLLSSAKWRLLRLHLNDLTHWGRVTHICIVELGHHWFR